MRIGLIEFLLILAIASLTVGPQVALFVDRWMRRANRANARAARRRAEYAAQAAAERDALLKRFRTASTVFGVIILLALVYALVFRPIDTPPQPYRAPEIRQDTGAVQTMLSGDALALGDYQGVDCIRARDGLVYAAAYNGATLKKRKSDLVRTDGGHTAAILSVDGELTGFAFDGNGDLWLTVTTPAGGTLCRAASDSWGTAVEQVVTQIDGAPLGEAADVVLKAALESKIETADNELSEKITALQTSMNEADEAIWTAIAEIRARLDEIQSGANSRDGELSDKIDALIAYGDKKESTYKAVIIVLAAIEAILIGVVALCFAKIKRNKTDK